MENRDLDKNMESGRSSSDVGGGRSRSRGGSSRTSSSGGMGRSSDRMRNRESGSDMDIPNDRGDDLQRRQSEGDLGNERVRDKSDSSERMRGTGE